jgi:tripartite-type tricarboxylate transporter receptor subunit TctC
MERAMVGVRRALIAVLILAGIGAGATVSAQDFPSRNVSLVVPLQAGTASDLVARILAEKMGAKIGRPVVVENVVGAGGAVGAQRVAHSAADGHVLGVLNNGIQTILPYLGGARLQFDPNKDLIAITMLARFPSILIVNKDLPARSLPELVSLAKQRPGELNYASVGYGSPQHLAMEELMALTGMNLTHVSYRGGTQATTAVLTGEANAFWIATSVALPFVQSGQVRALAGGERERTRILPDVPTVRELGIDYEYSPWVGLYAPAGTPAVVIERIKREATEAVNDADFKAMLAAQGLEAQSTTSDELNAIVAEESGRMMKLIKRLDLGQEGR